MAEEELETQETKETIPPEQEDRIVDKVTAKVKDIFKEIVGTPATPTEEVDEVVEPVEKEPDTPKAIEADMEAQVRAAVAKIEGEKKHEDDHEKLRHEPERAPSELRRVTKALWGGGD
jgi:hypothetical protein